LQGSFQERSGLETACLKGRGFRPYLQTMKVGILAGGFGTRLAEETTVRPKPMVEIGGYPILWHIMHCYAHYGFNEFMIALGYKGEVIKDYFINYHHRFRNLSVSLKTGKIDFHDEEHLDWNVHLLDTGLNSMTGGRIKQLASFANETFMLTYGDGVCDINLESLLAFHRQHGKLATVTAVRPPSRFGNIIVEGEQVIGFHEKPQIGEGWINGGFFVLEPEIIDYIDDNSTIWEQGPMERLAAEGQLMAYYHPNFWQCMDTLRDVQYLNKIWENGAPWKVWS
jgi:glucose-1-phosphate cytidylyltransferase